VCDVAQMPGDGCSPTCTCETDPCAFAVDNSVRLASVIAGLSAGASLSLKAGTYTDCAWTVASLYGADQRPMTVRGQGPSLTIVDCNHVSEVFAGIVSGTWLNLEGIHFANAQKSGGGGGLLHAKQGSHVVVSSCRVTRVASDGDGGALMISNSSLFVTDTHFEENSAEKGGALALVDGARAVLTSSVFTSCFAQNGGAVYVARASTCALDMMLLSLNTAVENKGGSILCEDRSTLNMTSCILSNGYAVRGAAIMVQHNSLCGITGNVSIVGNTCSWWGVIYALVS